MYSFDYWELLKQGPVVRTAIVLVSVMIGYLLGKIFGRAVERALLPRLDGHQLMVVKRAAFYLVLVLSAITGLNEAGINLNVLVGAAGVASVAIGFASQTTMSNLISGVFILLERPFMVGDTIKVGSTSGEVALMGLFSTILKTPENMMVRIPNETLMKSEITNATRYPLRRLELMLGVSYSADILSLRNLLVDSLNALPFVRKSPAVEVNFKSFGDSAIQVSAGFWVEREKAVEAYSLAADALKKAMDTAKISMPVPQRGLQFTPDHKIKVQVVTGN